MTDIRSRIKAVRINPYILSFFAIILALSTRLLLRPYIPDTTQLILFIIPILISAWYGGFKPGMFTTLLSVGIGGFLFMRKMSSSNRLIMSAILRLVIFFLEGFIISYSISQRMKSEKEREQILMNEKIARRKAEQQTRIREHFISVASHELKNPIASQKAYIQLLKRYLEVHNVSIPGNYVTKIESQANKLTNFINDLLDVSKMSSRKLQYTFAYFSMSECVKESIEHIENLLVTHKVILKGRVKKPIFGDKERIYQVLTNLISNAIKYSPQAKKVIITLSENRMYAKVSVQDFGVGIKPEFQEKIFNRFFRVSDGDDSSFEGFGLGLYITAQIIKRHKGKIWVKSEEGKGSVFSFSLPVRKRRA